MLRSGISGVSLNTQGGCGASPEELAISRLIKSNQQAMLLSDRPEYGAPLGAHLFWAVFCVRSP